MWWNDWWSGGWSTWMFFPPLMMLVFFAICMGMMMFMMRGRMAHGSRGRNAVEILEERFARGEINQPEYEERRRLLLRV
jgi:putative membrane protein